nr:hypothetical protein [Candidatus Njordarchaeota archaeon]
MVRKNASKQGGKREKKVSKLDKDFQEWTERHNCPNCSYEALCTKYEDKKSQESDG